MTDTPKKEKKPRKKTPKRRTNKFISKSKFYHFITAIGVLFFLCGCILTFIPYIQTHFVTKILKNYIHNLSESQYNFDNASLGLWDFSIHIKNFRINNPSNFPNEPAIQSDLIQIKTSISSDFRLNYKLYINNLKISLYHIPQKGTNIGVLLKTFDEQKQKLKPPLLPNISFLSISKVQIIITQNIEPQIIEIKGQNTVNFDKINYHKPLTEREIVQWLVDTFIAHNKDIPEDFRENLTHNK